MGKCLSPKHRICVGMPCSHAEIHVWSCTAMVPVLGVEPGDSLEIAEQPAQPNQ